MGKLLLWTGRGVCWSSPTNYYNHSTIITVPSLPTNLDCLAQKRMSAWPKTRLRIEQIGMELSLLDKWYGPLVSSLSSMTTNSTACPESINAKINLEFEKNYFHGYPSTDLPPEQIFEELEILGTGSSGNVLKMIHKPTGKICAVKRMRRTINDEENRRIYMDLQVVLKCESENIVKCYGYFIKESEVWICTELMTTCFDKLLRARQSPLPEKVLGALARSALHALCYLKEKHNIIHRDVKPSNILINEQGQIKLCDFGISGRLIDSLARTRGAGCIPYMAPERIDYHATYDIRADVWSLGVTLYELAVGKLPYDSATTEFDILVKVMTEEPPKLPCDMSFSDEFRDFVSTCLTKDCQLRPKYKQLMEHPFIIMHKNTVVTLDEIC